MNYSNVRPGEIVGQFKCIGITKDGLWGEFVLDNSQEWTEQQRQDWEAQKQQRHQAHQQTLAERQQRSLAPDIRHQQYSQIFNELSLHPSDQADLERRGFTPEQIELSGIKSVNQWQSLETKVDPQLPGVKSNGYGLLTQPGYVFPVRDFEGRIVACQQRLRNPSDGNRYRWLSSKAHTLQLFPEGCAPEGENPLAVYRPSETATGIALVEGTGAKPFLVAQRLKFLTLGASGGQWLSSPVTFKKSLEAFSDELAGLRVITLFPDAGDALNSKVIDRWRRVAKQLEEWGWVVKFGWWGQCTKDDLDIDELPLEQLADIQYLSPIEFGKVKTQSSGETEAICSNELGINFKIVRSSLDELLKVFPEIQTEAGKDWLKMRRFTPDQTINSKYFDWDSNQPGTNLAVRSGLGTGKTHHVHNRFLSDEKIGANAFGYRNALLIQFTERGNNWYHLQKDLKQSKDDLLLIADPNSRIAACFDSITYFQPHHFDGKRLVLDEIEGSLKHLYSSNTAVSFHRQRAKEMAGKAIANSEATIMLDGNLTDLTVAHAERISGKKFLKVENQYKGNRGKVSFYIGSFKTKKDEQTGETIIGGRKINDYSLLHKMMVEDEKPFICASDSQEKLEAWHEILKAKGRKVFRLDGSNSTTPEAKKFLADPVKYIKENGIEVILYSPTAESGLDINLQGCFQNSYYFFFGVVRTNEQIQFLGRLRDPNTHIYVFCQTEGIDSGRLEQTASQIQEEFNNYALACSHISLLDVSEGEKRLLINQLAQELIQKSNDPHFQHECHLKAKENFESNHLRECLEYALIESGYQVQVVEGFEVDRKELQIVQKAIQIRRSQEIYKARQLTDTEAEEKTKKFESTQQDKLELNRHYLTSRLPGIEYKSQTISKVVTLPQSAVAEIASGKISLDIAQKLCLPIPETATEHGSGVGHLPSGAETTQKLDTSNAETQAAQVFDLSHLPPNIHISQREGVPAPAPAPSDPTSSDPAPSEAESGEGEVQFVVSVTTPIFDPNLIRKLKFEDRGYLSRVELHFLMNNPEIAKLMQQRRWHKKLQAFSDPNESNYAKQMNLSTYKSDWLKVHTLLEMGIQFFLNPESRWTQDSPEAIEFWEKGKNAARAKYIGVSVGNSKPCEYIGRVLNRLEIKSKPERIKNAAGEKVRVYRIDSDYLASPVRTAVYECIASRIQAIVAAGKLKLDWDAIVDQKVASSMAETLVTEEFDLSHLPSNIYISQREGGLGGELLSEEEYTDEVIQQVCDDLASAEKVPDAETLGLLRQCWDKELLQLACKRLNPERRAQIKSWVLELNNLVQQNQSQDDHAFQKGQLVLIISAADRVHLGGQSVARVANKIPGSRGDYLLESLDGMWMAPFLASGFRLETAIEKIEREIKS